VPFPGHCDAGFETVAGSESGRWLCRATPTSEWRRCRHWAIAAVMLEGLAAAICEDR
jgi:hypothetical protein